MRFPLVTIGIPTFARPQLLKRALDSVALQDYKNIEVIVSDNGTPGSENKEIVESFLIKIPNLNYSKNSKNLGGLENFEKLLEQSRGDYFMFLADDDEISPTYVSSLVQTLEDNPSAVTAVANWHMAFENGLQNKMKSKIYKQTLKIFRAISFIWNSDDAFLYGIHRRKILQTIPLRRVYWNIIHEIDTYKAYLILFDLILIGKVIKTQNNSATWINHDYGVKYSGSLSYKKSSDVFVIGKKLILRLNVHCNYLNQIKRNLGIWAFLVVLPISCLAIIKEIMLFFLKRILFFARLKFLSRDT